MTVYTQTYEVTVDGSDNPEQLVLKSPWLNFTVSRWVVISNLTPYIAELTNVDDTGTNVPALPPNTANKYPWTGARGPIVINWNNPLPADTPPAATPNITVEFSDDPTGADLPGSYPAALSSSTTIGTIVGPVTIEGPLEVDGSVTINEPVDISAVGVGSLLSSGSYVPSGGVVTFNVAIPANVRTLILSMSVRGAFVRIAGASTGFGYFNGTPYLVDLYGSGSIIVTPVVTVADSIVTVTITTAAGSVAVDVWGDTAEYGEDIFYNGQAEQTWSRQTTSSTVTLLTGPARLLTAMVSVDVGAGTGQIILDGILCLEAAAQASPAANQVATLTFPPNTLLSAGATVTAVFSGAATCDMTLTYCYP